MRLANTLTRHLGPLFEKARITPQQWMLISTLRDAEEQPTLAGLARQMMVSKQNVTGMVRRLETLGLVKKAGDPIDLRSSRLTLTRKGNEVVEKIGPTYNKWVEQLFSGLAPAERKTLSKAIERLLESSS